MMPGSSRFVRKYTRTYAMLGPLFGLMLLLCSSQALAQDKSAFQAQQFRPWNDADGMFQTMSGKTLGQWKFGVGFILNYAKDPLILRNEAGDRLAGQELINHHIAADLTFGIGLASFLDIYLSIPLTLYQIGKVPNRPDLFNDLAGQDVSGFFLGDIRVGIKLGALSEDRGHPVSLGLNISVGIPSSVGGKQKNFNGEDLISLDVTAAFSKEIGEILGLGINFGYRYMNAKTDFLNLALEHELRYSLGLAFHLAKDRFDLVIDVAGAVALEKASLNSAPFDIYFGGKIFALGNRDLAINIGAGLPFFPGYGSPQFRIFLGVVYAPKDHDRDKDGTLDKNDKCPDTPGPKENKGCPWGDRDNDGLKDNVDKCPDKPGPKENQGCPWPDTDGDGLTDNIDKCPKTPGPKENKGCPYGDRDGDGLKDNVDKCPDKAGPKENKGCPWPDRDKDGILDKDDDCPDHPGPKRYKGCPDRDGDGVIDKIDKCPDVPGVRNPGPKGKIGCPKVILVKVKEDKIEILQKIFFRFGSAKIKRKSYPILDQVASVMKSKPQIKVRVEGHTDNVGSAAYNKGLSKRRAASVRKYLIGKGIEDSRLLSEGYGFEKPLVPNTSKKNRAKNRRVEFNILKKEE